MCLLVNFEPDCIPANYQELSSLLLEDYKIITGPYMVYLSTILQASIRSNRWVTTVDAGPPIDWVKA